MLLNNCKFVHNWESLLGLDLEEILEIRWSGYLVTNVGSSLGAPFESTNLKISSPKSTKENLDSRDITTIRTTSIIVVANSGTMQHQTYQSPTHQYEVGVNQYAWKSYRIASTFHIKVRVIDFTSFQRSRWKDVN